MYVDQSRYSFSWRKTIVLNLVITLSYVLFGNIGALFPEHIASFTPMWVPSGLSLGLVMIFGFTHTIPGMILGIAFLSLQNWAPGITIFGLILSNLTEIIVATLVLKSLGNGKFILKNPRDVFSFMIIGSFLAPFVASTIAITFIYMGGMLPADHLQSLWLAHFVSNSLSILVVTPLVVSSFNKDFRKINLWEASLLYGVVIIVCLWSFQGEIGRKLFMIPLLTWCALRFGFRGICIATILIGYLSVWNSTNVEGVFEKKSTDADILLIQMLMYGISIVGYFMATVVQAQETAHEKELELTIKEDALAILDQSLHHSPIGFALIDKEFKYIRVNEILAKINGVDANSHLGKTITDVAPAVADHTIAIIKDVFRTGKSFMNLPFAGHLPNNPDVYISGLVSYYPVRHPSSHEIFAVAFSLQNITEQLKIQNLLKENQERMRFAQEAGKIGAFEWNLKSDVIVWTPELENIYDLSSGEFNKTFDDWMNWIHPSDVVDLRNEIRKVLEGRCELNYQFRIITNSDELRWILARGKVLRDGEGERVKLIGINIDITEQKLIEQKLRMTEANLLHALSVRDEFMAIASHELKTPLTSLKLQIQLFERGVAKNDPLAFTQEKIKSFIEKNSQQIDRLTRLVDDMLDISRIRTGKFSLKKEPCDLNSMLNNILLRTKEQFEASGSGLPEVTCPEKAYGEWDPLRIEQVLTNIITNAIRYGLGRPISVVIQNHQETVRIMVKDNGLGIAKSDLDKIFMRYERGLLSREVSGLGLGLFITKQIVDAHGGKIWVESEMNKGSTFFVDLPSSSLSELLRPEETSFIEAGN